MERAVVASDVGELPATVVDGETGRIVPRGDVGALRDALTELLADPELARRFGAAGRARAFREFGWERVAALITAAFCRRECVSSR